MKFISVAEIAKKWNLSERTIRNYCSKGKINDAVMKGKTWYIPNTAQKPVKEKNQTLLEILKQEKKSKISGRIYHKIQIELTYNSNHIEGSTITHEQTRYIFETNTIGISKKSVKVDDIVETVNHFKCINNIIDNANYKLSENFIKNLHFILKNGTTDSRKNWFAVGNYKKLPNEVGGTQTTPPKKVSYEIKKLLNFYNKKTKKTLEDLIDFHCKFERIHPFQDGNGRIGRLLLFKECLKNNIVPFIITEDLKFYYYRGLAQWNKQKGYLTDTCLTAQDRFKKYLDLFQIKY
jgi:Fic family protein